MSVGKPDRNSIRPHGHSSECDGLRVEVGDEVQAETTQEKVVLSLEDEVPVKAEIDSEEIEAIEKAVEIISSGSVSGAADKHLPALVQTSFAQLRANGQSPSQARVAQYLQDKAKSLNSRVLSALAVRCADDPFVKVKKMIKVTLINA